MWKSFVASLAVCLSVEAQLAQTRLVFHSDRDLGVGSNLFQIYTINPDGTGLTRLTFSGANEGSAIWSPDGQKIAFYSWRDGQPDAYIMNFDGSDQSRLTTGGQVMGLGSFSPDGSKIAFVTNRDGNNEIYVMNVDGTGPSRLTADPSDDQIPLFSPDGSKIAFMSNRAGGDYDVYVANADGSSPQRLTSGQGRCVPTTWSPDGSKIGYHAGSNGTFQVWVMNPDGSNRVQLTNAANDNSEPTWSPDGTKIAFLSSRDHAWVYNVWMMNSDGSGQHAIETELAQHYSVRWSPVICDVPPPTISPSGPTTFCEGGSVTLTAPDGYASYLWSTGATTRSIAATTTHTYSVTVTDGSGCDATNAIIVTVNPLPPTPNVVANAPTTFCQGGSVRLTAPAGYAYSWNTGSTSQFIDVSTSGSYRVTVRDGNGCAASSADTVVIANAPPSAPTVAADGPTTFCQGGSVRLTAPAGYQYLWNTGASAQFIDVATSGSYRVTVRDMNGCETTSADSIVTVKSLPDTTVTITGAATLCPGETTVLAAPADMAGYSWSNGATSRFITVNAGTYSVIVTGANGCSAPSAPVVISAQPSTVITQEPANVTMQRNQTRQVTAQATGAGSLTYTWYRGNIGDTSQVHGVGQTVTVGPYSRKGTYNFWLRVTSSACPSSTDDSRQVVVTVN